MKRSCIAFQWCGGRLAALHKSGSRTSCGKYRDIMICNVHPKIYKKQFRTYLVDNLCRVNVEYMCGGFARRGCDFAVHWQRMYHVICRARRWSSACLYLDLRTAFASAIRHLIVEGPLSDDLLLRICVDLGFEPRHFEEFIRLLQEPSMKAAGLSNFLQEVSSMLVHNSWFRMDRSEFLALTSTGTNAGTLNDINGQLREKGAIENLTCGDVKSLIFPTGCSNLDEQPAVAGPAYIDDCANNFHSKVGPEDLIEKVKIAVPIILKSCFIHGFKPNMDKGKSSVVCKFRGRGAKAFDAKFRADGSSIVVECEFLGSVTLVCDSVVKHLGTKQNAIASNGNDIKYRSDQSQSSLHDMSRLLSSSHLATFSKELLVGAVCQSKQFFGAGSWYDVSHATLEYAENVYNKCVRASMNMKSNKHDQHSTVEVFKLSKHRPFEVRLRTNRIRYFLRFLASAPQMLRKLAHVEFLVAESLSWLHCICDDFVWLLQWSKAMALPRLLPHANPLPWWQICNADPQQIRVAILVAGDEMMRLGAHSEPFRDAQVFPCPCEGCTWSGRSKFELAGHLSNEHGKRNPLHRYVDTNTCPVCLKMFGDRYVVLKHVQYNSTNVELTSWNIFDRPHVISQSLTRPLHLQPGRGALVATLAMSCLYFSARDHGSRM